MDNVEAERTKVDRLTAKQRQCLELVVLRKSSKEIAREIGVPKPTVDQRIASAKQILGAKDRDEAALIFARHTQIYDRMIYDPARIPSAADSDIDHVSDIHPPIGLILNETAATASSGITEYQTSEGTGFRWSPSGDVGTMSRVGIIVGLTVGVLAMALIGLSVAQSLSGLLAAS